MGGLRNDRVKQKELESISRKIFIPDKPPILHIASPKRKEREKHFKLGGSMSIRKNRHGIGFLILAIFSSMLFNANLLEARQENYSSAQARTTSGWVRHQASVRSDTSSSARLKSLPARCGHHRHGCSPNILKSTANSNHIAPQNNISAKNNWLYAVRTTRET